MAKIIQLREDPSGDDDTTSSQRADEIPTTPCLDGVSSESDFSDFEDVPPLSERIAMSRETQDSDSDSSTGRDGICK